MTPAALFRRLRYDRCAEIAILQTGPAPVVPALVERVRAAFPGAHLTVVVRDDSLAGPGVLPGVRVEAVREGGGWDATRRLRRTRFDVVVVHLGGQAATDLGRMAPLLRARLLVAFNRNLDHFPVSVFRLGAIAAHVGADGGGAALAAWAVRRAIANLVVAPLGALALLARIARRRLRGPVPRRELLARRARAGAPPCA